MGDLTFLLSSFLPLFLSSLCLCLGLFPVRLSCAWLSLPASSKGCSALRGARLDSASQENGRVNRVARCKLSLPESIYIFCHALENCLMMLLIESDRVSARSSAKKNIIQSAPVPALFQAKISSDPSDSAASSLVGALSSALALPFSPRVAYAR